MYNNVNNSVFRTFGDLSKSGRLILVCYMCNAFLFYQSYRYNIFREKLTENVSLFVSENMKHVSEIISWAQIVYNLHKFMEFTEIIQKLYLSIKHFKYQNVL